MCNRRFNEYNGMWDRDVKMRALPLVLPLLKNPARGVRNSLDSRDSLWPCVYVYTYIYIYVCVCVCVCVWHARACTRACVQSRITNMRTSARDVMWRWALQW